jgi:hypothetical protein
MIFWFEIVFNCNGNDFDNWNENVETRQGMP